MDLKLHDEVEEGANLVELVVPRLSTCWLLLGIVEVDELQYQLKPATRHNAPKIVILIWPSITPVTPAFEVTNKKNIDKNVDTDTYRTVGNPQIPIPIRMAMKAFISSRVMGCLARSCTLAFRCSSKCSFLSSRYCSR